MNPYSVTARKIQLWNQCYQLSFPPQDHSNPEATLLWVQINLKSKRGWTYYIGSFCGIYLDLFAWIKTEIFGQMLAALESAIAKPWSVLVLSELLAIRNGLKVVNEKGFQHVIYHQISFWRCKQKEIWVMLIMCYRNSRSNMNFSFWLISLVTNDFNIHQ